MCQASEANCVTFGGDFAPFCGPFQRIPGHWLTDFVLRLTTAEANVHGSGGQAGINLNAADVEIAALELAPDFLAEWIIPDSGRDHRMLPEQRSDVSEVQRRSTKMLAGGKHVPESLAEPNQVI